MINRGGEIGRRGTFGGWGIGGLIWQIDGKLHAGERREHSAGWGGGGY